MTTLQRAALRLSVVLLTVMGALVGSIWLGGVSGTPRALAGTGTFYGADTTRMLNAIQPIWPQRSGAYCGIETAEAAVNYDDEVHGVARLYTSTTNQVTLARANQTTGRSQWGYATPVNAYAGITNIAPDFGTDPRSIAYMTWNATPVNVYIHDYIYRWQFANRTPPSFAVQVKQATTNVARALETWHEPVNVAINGGLHSVLVTAVFSLSDPATSYPASITSVVYRDPESSASTSRFEVDFATWANGNYATPHGIYSLWSLYYGDKWTRGDRKNTSDPEPSVGPYRPTANNPVHWYGGVTWIQRDNNYANGAYSPDYAYSSTGVKLTSP